MGFYQILSDIKFPQISRIFLSILTDFNNAAVLSVSAYPLTSMSSCPFIIRLGIVLSAPVIIGITVIFMFHGFLVL